MLLRFIESTDLRKGDSGLTMLMELACCKQAIQKRITTNRLFFFFALLLSLVLDGFDQLDLALCTVH